MIRPKRKYKKRKNKMDDDDHDNDDNLLIKIKIKKIWNKKKNFSKKFIQKNKIFPLKNQ